MNRSTRAVLTLALTSTVIAVIGLVLASQPLLATTGCSNDGHCGCAATATHPVTGVTCDLSSWACHSIPNGCDQTCGYTCGR